MFTSLLKLILALPTMTNIIGCLLLTWDRSRNIEAGPIHNITLLYQEGWLNGTRLECRLQDHRPFSGPKNLKAEWATRQNTHLLVYLGVY